MYRSLFSRDVFAELDCLQRDLQQAFAISPSMRGFASGTYFNRTWPAMNVATTPQSVEVYCFAPGVECRHRPFTKTLSISA